MTQKSIIIIGAGIAGLAAGCYAQMNGYRSKIFELHTLPGGLCTSWERENYIFDGCIHYLLGSGAGQPFFRMWQELGAVQGRQMVNHEAYQEVTDGKKTLVVYVDPDRLEAHMLELAPADARLIRSFTRGVRQFAGFDFSVLYGKPRELLSLREWLVFLQKMIPFTGPLLQWALPSMGDFARKFSDPFLKRAVAQMFTWDEAPVMMGMMLLAYMNRGNAGFPMGGSLAFARAIEKRYLELGGEI